MDEILNVIESVSRGFPTYSYKEKIIALGGVPIAMKAKRKIRR